MNLNDPLEVARLWSPYGLTNLWAIMEILDAGSIVRAIASLSNYARGIPDNSIPKNVSQVLPAHNLEHLQEHTKLLCGELTRLGLGMSLSCATAIRDILATTSPCPAPNGMSGEWVILSPHKSGELKHSCGELARRLPDELGMRVALAVPLNKSEFYRQAEPPFGKQVEIKFSSLIDEISEAAKCYALGRATACAFHSIRCLEAGVGAMSRCLGIPDPTKASDRNWGRMLSKIKDAIDAKWPSNSDRLTGDGEFFDSAYAALAAMQNPYRNATMHLDQKYTEEEAKHVLDMVKGFMSKLAVRMDETGEPKAF